MFKTLIIIRHGKAEDGYGKEDFKRDLAPKGKLQSQINAEKISKSGLKIDLLLHSSAYRTTQTADLTYEPLKEQKTRIISSPKLYLCSASDLLDELVAQAQDEDNCIMIIGHNNGLSDFFNEIVTNPFYNTLSTGEMAIVKLKITSWAELYKPFSSQLIVLEKPKTKN